MRTMVFRSESTKGGAARKPWQTDKGAQTVAKKPIKYRSGYKYQLAADCPVATSIKPKTDIATKFITLTKAGKLTVLAGYAWDGPSGPVPDTRLNMRASLFHDALYQLMRKKKLTRKVNKEKADKLFQKFCVEDGVPKPIAKAYYLGLQLGGKPATDPKNQKKVRTAP